MDAVEGVCAPDGSPAPCRRFEAEIVPDEPGVLWYSFRIVGCDGSTAWYGAQQGWTAGEGALYGWEPPSFQLTVHTPREDVPSWYADGIVYQVFPDRFARGEGWRALVEGALSAPRRGPARRLVEDWSEPPSYKRAPNGDIAEWGFYGGTLSGVREKLGYLEDLGVTVLYLNPIFEAASSHRYDTADYFNVDPALGTLDDFRRLCSEAADRGISVILDGVFNHAGRDSRYFNSYGNYPDLGAAQSPDSPYRDWFRFNDDGSYESWWGVKDLPEYDESAPSLREFFCGENGVVRFWLRNGARGWRLDVADELPDSFIRDIRAAALAERPDAVVIGEVWEDASNKYAYGELRHYFQGEELDGVMNYPLRRALIDYLTGAVGAPVAARRMNQLAENYPTCALRCCLNLLGSHDRERIMTVLGGAPAAGELDEAARASFRLSPDQRALALNRLKIAALLQFTAPGVPSVYYGDEVGLEGYSDPFNRATMPWSGGDRGVFDMVRSMAALRRSLPVFSRGTFEAVSFGDEVLGWWRRDEASGESVLVIANRSPWDWANVEVAAEGEEVSELVRAEAARIVGGRVAVTLRPFESSALYFHPATSLQADMPGGTGVIAHVTSVPAESGPGTLGSPARSFVDWLAERGFSYWQMLPVNPTDEYGSPYAGLSAFAGNPRLVEWPEDRGAYLEGLRSRPDFPRFCEESRGWLDPYCAFCAVKELVGDVAWQEWPARYRDFASELCAALLSPAHPLAADVETASDSDGPACGAFRKDGGSPSAFSADHDGAIPLHLAPAELEELRASADRVRLEQFAFRLQWDELRRYANERGVAIIGDIPMYVSADSADVWANRSCFALDDRGFPD